MRYVWSSNLKFNKIKEERDLRLLVNCSIYAGQQVWINKLKNILNQSSNFIFVCKIYQKIKFENLDSNECQKQKCWEAQIYSIIQDWVDPSGPHFYSSKFSLHEGLGPCLGEAQFLLEKYGSLSKSNYVYQALSCWSKTE